MNKSPDRERSIGLNKVKPSAFFLKSSTRQQTIEDTAIPFRWRHSIFDNTCKEDKKTNAKLTSKQHNGVDSDPPSTNNGNNNSRRRFMQSIRTALTIARFSVPISFSGVTAAANGEEQHQTDEEIKKKEYAQEEEGEEPMECRNGAIVAEDKIPGAYQQMCMSLPERTVTLPSTGDTIVISQGTTAGTTRGVDAATSRRQEGGGGGTLAGRTGVAVWNSSLLLTRLLDALVGAEADGRKNFLRNKTILELGCGTGLTSIAAAKLGAQSVIATDGNPDVIQLAQENIDRNGVGDMVTVTELRWGLLDASDYYDTADIVIGSDLTYNSGSWRVLVETLNAVLKPGGFFLYLTLGHSGFSAVSELGGFLTVAKSEGLVVLKEEDSKKWPFRMNGRNVSLSSLLGSSMATKEKTVIDETGGVGIVVLSKV